MNRRLENHKNDHFVAVPDPDFVLMGVWGTEAGLRAFELCVRCECGDHDDLPERGSKLPIQSEALVSGGGLFHFSHGQPQLG